MDPLENPFWLALTAQPQFAEGDEHARRYRSVADTLALVESVTFDDLHRVLEAWPLEAPSATVLAGPL